MIHIDEDRLLAYVLEVSESEDERAGIAAHLKECADCRKRWESLRGDVAIIGGVQPYQRVLSMPTTRVQHVGVYAILRAAALIVFGIVVGFGAASRIYREPAHVSPAYVALSSPTDPFEGHAATDATGISALYYENLLEDE